MKLRDDYIFPPLALAASITVAGAVVYFDWTHEQFIQFFKTFGALIGAFIGVIGAYWIATSRKLDDEYENQRRIIQSFTADFVNAQNQLTIYFNTVDDILDRELSKYCKDLNVIDSPAFSAKFKNPKSDRENIRAAFFAVKEFMKISDAFRRYKEHRRNFDNLNTNYFKDFVYALHLFESILLDANKIPDDCIDEKKFIKFFISLRHLISYDIMNSPINIACKNFNIEIEKLKGSMLIGAFVKITLDNNSRLI